jgi:hypothetical protein
MTSWARQGSLERFQSMELERRRERGSSRKEGGDYKFYRLTVTVNFHSLPLSTFTHCHCQLSLTATVQATTAKLNDSCTALQF